MPPLNKKIKFMITIKLVNVRSIVPHHRKEASKVIDNIISSTAMLYCSTIILSVLGGFAYVH